MIVSKTPLRVSFLGGGSDFRAHFQKHGGAVLSSTIDKYVYVTVSPSHDHRVHVHYTHIEVCDKSCEVKHDIVREALLQAGIESGIEIHTIADVPSTGTGLGSSSALAVGLVNALRRYLYGPQWMNSIASARLACEIEIDRLHKPIGEQDQYIAALGGVRLIEWDTEGDVSTKPYVSRYPPEYLTERVMLFDTGIVRDTETILTQQNAQVERNAVALKSLAQLARNGYERLREGYYDKFGLELDIAWRLKRDLASNISNSLIDSYYDTARRAGAWGGKICGAGGGGYLLLVAPPDRHDAIRNALGLREMKVKLGVEGSTVREV